MWQAEPYRVKEKLLKKLYTDYASLVKGPILSCADAAVPTGLMLYSVVVGQSWRRRPYHGAVPLSWGCIEGASALKSWMGLCPK